ncbi:TPA: hypothetical protein ACH3X2_000836 [Trebouxia sp. C0005]
MLQYREAASDSEEGQFRHASQQHPHLVGHNNQQWIIAQVCPPWIQMGLFCICSGINPKAFLQAHASTGFSNLSLVFSILAFATCFALHWLMIVRICLQGLMV